MTGRWLSGFKQKQAHFFPSYYISAIGLKYQDYALCLARRKRMSMAAPEKPKCPTCLKKLYERNGKP